MIVLPLKRWSITVLQSSQTILPTLPLTGCIVDTIKSSNVESHCDALLYSAGALKHLSNSNLAVQKEIVSCGGIQALASVMNSICCEVCIKK